MSPEVRPGERNDVSAIVGIYNHYVETTHVTFDTEPVTLDDRIRWFRRFANEGPHRLLVAAVKNEVVGYACSSPFHPKPVYARSVETCIYLSPDHCGVGVGTQLYRSLIQLLEAEHGVHRLYAGITLLNERSLALHRKLGFEPAVHSRR